MSIRYEKTPTLYFDPTASGSSGVGTYANPFTTGTQILAYLTANPDMSGQVIGFKRGTQYNGEISLSGFYGTAGNPVFMCAYGDADALPILSGGNIYTDWAQVSGTPSVWYKSGFGSEPEPYDVSDGIENRLYKVAAQASAQATIDAVFAAGIGSSGYYSGALYIYPYDGNPNLGQIEVATTLDQFSIVPYKNADNKAGGLVISGLHVRSSLRAALLVATTGYTGAGVIAAVDVIGCKAGLAGVNNTSGLAGDCILVNGTSDAKRIQSGRIAGNYCYGGIFHAMEVSYHDGLIVEHNEGHYCHGRSIIELWSGVSNCKVRYNKGFGPDEKTTRAAVDFATTVSSGIWCAGYYDGSNRDATKNTGNEYYYNLVRDVQKAPSGTNACYGINHCGAAGKAYNNTLIGDFVTAQGIKIGAGATASVALDMKNNLIANKSNTGGSNFKTDNAANNFTSDYNAFCRNSGASASFMITTTGVTGSPITSIATWNGAGNIANQAGSSGASTVGGHDIASIVTLDADGRPIAGSAVLNAGTTIAGYTHADVDGNAILGAPTIGCYQLLPANSTVSVG